MKILSVLRKGAVKSALSYKLLITMWLITLVMVMLVAMPLRLGLKVVFSKSFAVDRLIDGFDLGLIGDMGPAFGQLMASAILGGLLLLVAGFLLHTFFAGGLFTRYTTAYGDFGVGAFMKASTHHFLTYLGIAIIMIVLIAAWTTAIIALPMGISSAVSGGSEPEWGLLKILVVVWALGLPIWFLVADHSRRWVASTGTRKVFKALKEGFGALSRKFPGSYLAILMIFIINILFVGFALWITAWLVPGKALMVFLLFLATQMLFLIRLFLKAWRYATVTELALRPAEG